MCFIAGYFFFFFLGGGMMKLNYLFWWDMHNGIIVNAPSFQLFSISFITTLIMIFISLKNGTWVYRFNQL
jgi:hypothetical protein